MCIVTRSEENKAQNVSIHLYDSSYQNANETAVRHGILEMLNKMGWSCFQCSFQRNSNGINNHGT